MKELHSLLSSLGNPSVGNRHGKTGRKEFDWGTSSNAQRKVLALVTRELMHDKGLTLQDVLDLSQPPPRFTPVPGFSQLFKDGEMARPRSRDLYEWLCKAHPYYAAKVDQQLLGITPDLRTLSWDTFVGEYARHGLVRLEQSDPNKPPAPTGEFRRIARYDPAYETTIKVLLNVPFRLRFEGSLGHQVAGVQRTREGWFAIPLSDDHLHCDAWSGSQPFEATTRLVEHSELGQRRMVFIFIVPDVIQAVIQDWNPDHPLSPPILSSVAEAISSLPQDAWTLGVMDVHFEPWSSVGGSAGKSIR